MHGASILHCLLLACSPNKEVLVECEAATQSWASLSARIFPRVLRKAIWQHTM